VGGYWEQGARRHSNAFKRNVSANRHVNVTTSGGVKSWQTRVVQRMRNANPHNAKHPHNALRSGSTKRQALHAMAEPVVNGNVQRRVTEGSTQC